MREQPRLPFNGAFREIVVLEPHGDRGQCGVVPRLAVGESLVEFADEIGRFIRHLPHAPARRLVQMT